VKWLRRLFPRRSQPAPSTLEIARFFNEAAHDEEHFPSSIDPRIYHVRLLLSHLGDVSGRLVADIGCGKGRFARIVAARNPGARVIALDLAEAMLRSADASLLRCAASMTALPLATASCDGAFAIESLEHAVDIKTAIIELCRIVRPGGRILIIDKNAQQWGRLETPAWEQWFGQRDLEKLLGRHCREVSSRLVSYWEDVEPDGLFIAWLATK
jgi:ubiquinone/menaquinone biosynthesis C-methylase UbiE